ncbi:hypothetical protein EVJ58_g1559 [Rhodofomes roseus]|uniref:Uncharacterized protein n=1 Tax=Rhodofomes roseus TaxID=34475 RepID=A0A4Y9Z0U1_9APHY|nr:hypothetical protein EVJ58_g1559 [Rhodofomes roseus]
MRASPSSGPIISDEKFGYTDYLERPIGAHLTKQCLFRHHYPRWLATKATIPGPANNTRASRLPLFVAPTGWIPYPSGTPAVIYAQRAAGRPTTYPPTSQGGYAPVTVAEAPTSRSVCLKEPIPRRHNRDATPIPNDAPRPSKLTYSSGTPADPIVIEDSPVRSSAVTTGANPVHGNFAPKAKGRRRTQPQIPPIKPTDVPIPHDKSEEPRHFPSPPVAKALQVIRPKPMVALPSGYLKTHTPTPKEPVDVKSSLGVLERVSREAAEHSTLPVQPDAYDRAPRDINIDAEPSSTTAKRVFQAGLSLAELEGHVSIPGPSQDSRRVNASFGQDIEWPAAKGSLTGHVDAAAEHKRRPTGIEEAKVVDGR